VRRQSEAATALWIDSLNSSWRKQRPSIPDKSNRKEIPQVVKRLTLGMICVATIAAQTSSSRQYPIDNNHSTIGFSVSIRSGMSKVTGKFTDFAITLNNDEKDITKSSVTAVIKTASINTGIEARDKDLRSAAFFDAEK
jgi:polyisoprenoid-binding protein YceI